MYIFLRKKLVSEQNMLIIISILKHLKTNYLDFVWQFASCLLYLSLRFL